MRVPYAYLDKQFADPAPILEDIERLVRTGDFTLGYPVRELEDRFAQLTGLPYAIGVSSGTDALMLSLQVQGVGFGDEVIVPVNTFVATVGAIAMTGAKPVFVDNTDDYTIDVDQIEVAITPRTRAILPVHLTGTPADMPRIMAIAERHNLIVVEDAAQAILATLDGQHVGSWGSAAGFSMHPLKNLNIWGDGGVILTRSEELRDKLRLFRNHGLANRDEIAMWGYNCRLDSLQAVVANRVIEQVPSITERRRANARYLDQALAGLREHVTLPPRRPNVNSAFHTYVIQARDRDALNEHLLAQEIEVKIHYPVPLHLQPAARELGYKAGDFPVCERHCTTILTLPVHEHLTPAQLDFMVEQIGSFYARRGAAAVAASA
jgi:dTDP-4-amino-4,6-dideoxygalactose transaminase